MAELVMALLPYLHSATQPETVRKALLASEARLGTQAKAISA